MGATGANSALHSYIRDATQACDRLHSAVQAQFIREVGEDAGRYIEATRRPGGRKGYPLDIAGYADLVVELMGEAGAPVQVHAIEPQALRLVNTFCPFADPLGSNPPPVPARR